MPEMPTVPVEFFDITLGQILTWVFIFLGTCQGVKTIRAEMRAYIRELHDGLMLDEERRIAQGERTPLYRIIERTFYRLFHQPPVGNGGIQQ